MKLTKSPTSHNNWFIIKPRLTGILVFLLFCIIFSLIISQQYQIAKKAKYDAIHTNLQAIHKNIEQSLKKNYVEALTLALTINDKGIPENFELVAKQILASDTNIDALQLVPNGIIRYTYPLKGNEAAMGINIFKSKIHEFEARQAVKNKKMYFAGPDQLKQGGLGIVGRVPVYKHNKFWGFSAVVIRLNTLLEIPEIKRIDSSKYYFQISKIHPITQKETFFLTGKEIKDSENAVTSFIVDGDWKLYLVDKKPNELLFTFVIRSLLALFLASLIGFLITSFFKKPAELEILLRKQSDKLLKNEIKFKSIFDQADQAEKKLKFVASYDNGKAKVGLQQIGSDSDFYHLYGKDNVVLFYTERYPEQPLVVKGAGAGADVTASGVFADIIRAARI